MQLVEASNVSGLDLIVAGGLAQGDAGGFDWPAPEVWPVRLQYGVTVIAPNIHFVPPVGGPAAAFEVNASVASDVAPVGILGGSTAPVVIGIDTQGLNLKSTTIAVDDGANEPTGHNLPLTLSNAWLNGTNYGMRVGPGANVTFSNVAIGSTYTSSYIYGGSQPLQGSTGILCTGSSQQAASIRALGYSSLSIDSQLSRDIDAEGYCNLSLSQVTLGISAPFGSGVGVCPAKVDGTGLFMNGPNTFSAADLFTVQCMDSYGLYLTGLDAGIPDVSATYANIQNCGCAGVYLVGGARFSAYAQVRACQIGVQINEDWRQIPGDFNPSPSSSVICNSAAEPSDTCRTPAGIDVLNDTSDSTVVAQGLLWAQWDDADGGNTQVWGCTDRSLSKCVCQGTGCSGNSTPEPLVDGADAVYFFNNSAPFNVQGGSQSYSGCN